MTVALHDSGNRMIQVMKRPVIALVLLALVGAGLLWHFARAPRAAGKTEVTSAPIPVIVANVSRKDVPIYLMGLGTVQASNTVTVTAQVEGVLEKVTFVEGQDVKKGQLLAQIDPRPYQAQLEQAIAKKAVDEAQLEHARRDLERYAKLAPLDYTSKLTFDATTAQVGDNLFPHRPFAVELYPLYLHVRSQRKERRPSQVLSRGTSESPYELKRDRERLMRAMECCDFQNWKVESLTKHVDADNPVKFRCPKLLDSSA